MRIEDDALVLRRIPFREASWIVSLMTPRHGVFSAVARDVRREGGDARAALNGFHGLRVDVRARGADAMGSLVGVEITRMRHRLPFMPVAAAAAQVLGEAVYRNVEPGDVQQVETHALLERALDALDAGSDPVAVVGGTFVHLLRLFGYGWRLDSCIGCGCRDSLNFFSIRRGATVCLRCGAPYASRLLVVNEKVRHSMARVDFSLEMAVLSRHDWAVLYQVGLARLVVTGGRPLAADVMFRRLAGLSSGVGVLNVRKGLRNDRQGIA